MVLLTMTPLMVDALETLRNLENVRNAKDVQTTVVGTLESEDGGPDGSTKNGKVSVNSGIQGNEFLGENEGSKRAGDMEIPQEPTLSNPRAGNPISHGQVIDLWKKLKAHDISPHSLENLLRGARVYTSPPKPKSEKVPLHG